MDTHCSSVSDSDAVLCSCEDPDLDMEVSLLLDFGCALVQSFLAMFQVFHFGVRILTLCHYMLGVIPFPDYPLKIPNPVPYPPAHQSTNSCFTVLAFPYPGTLSLHWTKGLSPIDFQQGHPLLHMYMCTLWLID